MQQWKLFFKVFSILYDLIILTSSLIESSEQNLMLLNEKQKIYAILISTKNI